MKYTNLPPKLAEIDAQAKFLKSWSWILFALSRFNIGGDTVKELAEQANDEVVKAQLFLRINEKFNFTFQESGWVLTYYYTDLELANQALDSAENGDILAAERILTNAFLNQNLDSLVGALHGVRCFRKRMVVLNEAKQLCHEERFLGAIPLILITIDGVGKDYFGRPTFTEGLDLEEPNSLVCANQALNELTKKITKTRKQINEEGITFPYRNGILHGLDINYGNALVAAKAWSYLFCIADLIKTKEEQKNAKPEKSLSDVLARCQETNLYIKAVDTWMPRPEIKLEWTLSSDSVDFFEEGTPEKALAIFLSAWSRKNYGIMGEMTVYFDNRPIHFRASLIRKYCDHLFFQDAKIIKITDIGPSEACIECCLNFNNQARGYNFTFSLIYGDEYSDSLALLQKNGSWKVLHSYQSIELC